MSDERDRELDFYRRRVDALAAETLRSEQTIAALAREVRERSAALDVMSRVHGWIAGLKDEREILATASHAISEQLKIDRIVVFARVGEVYEPVVQLGIELTSLEGDPFAGLDAGPMVIDGNRDTEKNAERGSAQDAQLLDLFGAAALIAVRLPSDGPRRVMVFARTLKHSTSTQISMTGPGSNTFVALAQLIAVTVNAARRNQEFLALELQMAGGFAHEIRNALSAARLVLSHIDGVPSSTTTTGGEDEALAEPMTQRTVRRLIALRAAVHDRLPPEAREELDATLAAIVEDERIVDGAVNEARFATERALSITQDILAYARSSAGSPGRERIEVRAVVDRAVQAVRAAHPEVEVDVDVDADATREISESHLFSIVFNLLDNAAAASQTVVSPRVSLAFERGPSGDQLRVVDHGHGITPAHLGQVFDPFFSTKGARGTGLGLGMVRKLSLLYGAHVELESGPGGTTALVHWPPEAP